METLLDLAHPHGQLLGLPIVLYRAYLPESVQSGAETAVGVMMTSAPKALRSRTFSWLILSGIVKMHL